MASRGIKAGRLFFEISVDKAEEAERKVEQFGRALDNALRTRGTQQVNQQFGQLSTTIKATENTLSSLKNQVDAGLISQEQYAERLRGVQKTAKDLTRDLDESSSEFRRLTGIVARSERELQRLTPTTDDTKEAFKRLRDETLGLRSEYQATGEDAERIKRRLAEIRDEALSLRPSVTENAEAFKQLSQVARTADATIAGMEGRVSRLGLASQVQLGALAALRSELSDIPLVGRRVGLILDLLVTKFGAVGGAASSGSLGIAAFNQRALRLNAAIGVGLVAAIGLGFAALVRFTRETARYADEVDKAAQRTQMSVEAYQRLRNVLSVTSGSMSAVERAVQTLNERLRETEGSSNRTQQALRRLGISVRDEVTGEFRQVGDITLEAIRRLQGIENQAQRNILANDLLGRAYRDLIPLLNTSAEEFDELFNNAEKLGRFLEEDAIQALVNYQDRLNIVQQRLLAVRDSVALALLPVLERGLLPLLENLLLPALTRATEHLANLATRFFDASEEGDQFRATVANMLGPLLGVGRLLQSAAQAVASFGAFVIGTAAGIGAALGTLSVQIEQNTLPTLVRLLVAINPFTRDLRDIGKLDERLALPQTAAGGNNLFDELRQSFEDASRQWSELSQALFQDATASFQSIFTAVEDLETILSDFEQTVNRAAPRLTELGEEAEASGRKVRTVAEVMEDLQRAMALIDEQRRPRDGFPEGLLSEAEATEARIRALLSAVNELLGIDPSSPNIQGILNQLKELGFEVGKTEEQLRRLREELTRRYARDLGLQVDLGVTPLIDAIKELRFQREKLRQQAEAALLAGDFEEAASIMARLGVVNNLYEDLNQRINEGSEALQAFERAQERAFSGARRQIAGFLIDARRGLEPLGELNRLGQQFLQLTTEAQTPAQRLRAELEQLAGETGLAAAGARLLLTRLDAFEQSQADELFASLNREIQALTSEPLDRYGQLAERIKRLGEEGKLTQEQVAALLALLENVRGIEAAQERLAAALQRTINQGLSFIGPFGEINRLGEEFRRLTGQLPTPLQALRQSLERLADGTGLVALGARRMLDELDAFEAGVQRVNFEALLQQIDRLERAPDQFEQLAEAIKQAGEEGDISAEQVRELLDRLADVQTIVNAREALSDYSGILQTLINQARSAGLEALASELEEQGRAAGLALTPLEQLERQIDELEASGGRSAEEIAALREAVALFRAETEAAAARQATLSAALAATRSPLERYAAQLGVTVEQLRELAAMGVIVGLPEGLFDAGEAAEALANAMERANQLMGEGQTPIQAYIDELRELREQYPAIAAEIDELIAKLQAFERRVSTLEAITLGLNLGRDILSGLERALNADDVKGALAGITQAAAGIASFIPGGQVFAPLISAAGGLLGGVAGFFQRIFDPQGPARRAIAEGVSGAIMAGAQDAFSRFRRGEIDRSQLRQALEDSIGDAIYRAVVGQLIESTLIIGALKPLLDQIAAAILAGNQRLVNELIGQIPAILGRALPPIIDAAEQLGRALDRSLPGTPRDTAATQPETVLDRFQLPGTSAVLATTPNWVLRMESVAVRFESAASSLERLVDEGVTVRSEVGLKGAGKMVGTVVRASGG